MNTYASLNLPKKRYFAEDAGLGRRLIAVLFDILIIEVIILSPFASVFEKALGGSFMQNLTSLKGGFPGSLLFIFIFASAAAVIYFTLFQCFFRQTLGMMVAGIHIEGNSGFWNSFLRSTLAIPFFPFYLLWIVEPAFVLYRKRGLLEQLTGTRTVLYRQMD